MYIIPCGHWGSVETNRLMTREILFPTGDIRTDSLLYREKSGLLLPEPFTQNLFYAVSDEMETRFFIASESRLNLEKMEAFFLRLYGAIFQDCEDPVKHAGSTVFLKSTIRNARVKEFYHPRFVRNMLDYSSIDRSARISYCVSVRSGRHVGRKGRRYNISVSVGFDSRFSRRKFMELIDSELSAMKREARFVLKKSGRGILSDNTLSQSFNLINFIRIPSEQDLVV